MVICIQQSKLDKITMFHKLRVYNIETEDPLTEHIAVHVLV